MSKKKSMSENDNPMTPEILHIDKHLLDEEWVNQPKLYFEYASELALARQELEEAKAEFDVVKAETDLTIRSNPADYDLPEKTTEVMIGKALILTDEYADAQKVVFIAQYRVNILSGAQTALDHRKKALEKLVDLHGRNYFSSPKVDTTHMGSKEVEDFKENIKEIENEKVRARNKKKRRRRKNVE